MNETLEEKLCSIITISIGALPKSSSWKCNMASIQHNTNEVILRIQQQSTSNHFIKIVVVVIPFSSSHFPFYSVNMQNSKLCIEIFVKWHEAELNGQWQTMVARFYCLYNNTQISVRIITLTIDKMYLKCHLRCTVQQCFHSFNHPGNSLAQQWCTTHTYTQTYI